LIEEIAFEGNLLLKAMDVRTFTPVAFNMFCRVAYLTKVPLKDTWIKVSSIQARLINHCHHDASDRERQEWNDRLEMVPITPQDQATFNHVYMYS